MIPSIEILNTELVETNYVSKTYKIVVSADDESISRIKGYADGLDSIRQAVNLILSTERYAFLIYSWDYGVELIDLIGKPTSYVMSELPRRIEEALLVDDRIEGVTDFEFDKNGEKLHTKFTVITKLGEIKTELEVGV